MTGYVYSLSDNNSNVFYIGSSTMPEYRAKTHKGSSRYFDEIDNEFVNYNSFEFSMEIVDEIDFKFRQELFELESYWIHQFISWGFSLRNVSYKHKNYKVPNDIIALLKIKSSHINPYRTVESDAFVTALYKIIREYKEIIQSNLNRQAMPCTGTSDNNNCGEFFHEKAEPRIKTPYPESDKIKNNIKNLQDENVYLSACLCAVLNECISRNIFDEIIRKASENGAVDIFKFWSEHEKKDKQRLSHDLMKYSNHEQSMIAEILKEKIK